jgi:hypothetical protein
VGRSIAEIFGKETPLGRATVTDSVTEAGTGVSEVSFLVDGVPMLARDDGVRLRLTCTVAERAPSDERALRRLLTQFLAEADHGRAVFYCDGDGRLLLTEEVRPEADAHDLAATFFDTAIHWTKMLRGLAMVPEPSDLRSSLIFP